MGYFFLDIETYSDRNNPDSSLNPYYPESKVIVISYNYYSSFKHPIKEEIKTPTFLKEWESSEKMILSDFYKILKRIQKKDNYLKIIGFNILSFDLPYLFGRMKILEIADESELYKLLFRSRGIDIYQLSSIISEKTIEYKTLIGISHKKVTKFFNMQTKEGSGLECSRWYDDKQYDKIIKYCTEEFNFEQLLDAFYLYITNKLSK